MAVPRRREGNDRSRSIVKSGGKTLAERQITLKPVRKWVVYLLPHSHVDIGYTQLQADVEKKQWQNIDAALELIRKTADYPPEARFKWNAEVLWAVDSYLRQGAAGEAAATDRRHPRRRGRTRRPVRQRVDRAVPAGGTAAADAMGRPASAGAAA